jgi:hypothetical protein
MPEGAQVLNGVMHAERGQATGVVVVHVVDPGVADTTHTDALELCIEQRERVQRSFVKHVDLIPTHVGQLKADRLALVALEQVDLDPGTREDLL